MHLDCSHNRIAASRIQIGQVIQSTGGLLRGIVSLLEGILYRERVRSRLLSLDQGGVRI